MFIFGQPLRSRRPVSRCPRYGRRQKAPLLQCGVDLRGYCAIGRRPDSRLDLGDQVQEAIFACLRVMHSVAHPLGDVLAGIVGVEVVGRADELRCRRDDVRLTPAQFGARPGAACPRLAPRAARMGHLHGRRPRATASHHARWSMPGWHGLRASSGAGHPQPAARNHSGATTVSVIRACRIVSPTTSRRFRARTAARICVESVRCRPFALTS